MKIKGTCDFCGKEVDGEGGLYDDKKIAKKRPKDWAGMFPWNKSKMPMNCTFSPEKLKEYGVTTRFACPECFR